MTFQPFGFDRIFVDSPPAALAIGDGDTLAIELEIAQAELGRLADAHRAELARARADGFDAGLAQARHERDAALLAAVDALHAGIEGMAGEIDDMRAELSRDAAALALAAAGHIAGQALGSVPGAAVDAAIGRALAQVPRGTELVVRVHPDIAADIEARIVARQAGDRRRLHLHVAADATLPPGDARIEWDAGGLSLDRAAREAAVLKEIDGLLAAAGPAPRAEEMP